MQFALRTAAQIVFGRGERRRIPELVAGWEGRRRVLLVTGRSSLQAAGHLAPLVAGLGERGFTVTELQVGGEPDIAVVDAAVATCRAAECELVLAVGGGSVLDVGKAIAALATNPGPAIEYLEDVGLGPPRPLARPPLPVCAAPTTAGSGSEVTRNAVLRVPALAVKRSMRSDLMLPRLAVIDPDLAAGAPLHVAAAAGLDALTHLLEGYVSRGAQPTTDLLAWRGLELIVAALGRLAATADPGRTEAAVGDDLALASLWGGIVLANAGLGAVHGLVAPLGGLCGVAHGDGCACLLPATFETNVLALRRRQPDSPALRRYEALTRLLCGDAPADPGRAAARLLALRRSLGVPSLAAQGVGTGHVGRIVAGARGGSMRSNPIELSDAELEGILLASLDDGGGAS